MTLREQLLQAGASDLAIAWRCDQDPLLAGGGAAGGDGGADAGGLDPERRGQLRDGAALGGRKAVDQAGDRLQPQASSEAPSVQAPLRNGLLEQVAEGFGRAPFDHGRRSSGSLERNLAVGLDYSVETVESVEADNGHYQNSPGSRPTSHGGTAAEASTEPRKESDTMTTVAFAPASAQQTADRLPRNLRRAFLLGIRAQRTRRRVYPDGIYTARNQEWKAAEVFGTVQQERAEKNLTDRERHYFRAGLSAVSQSYGKGDGERVLRIRRYARLLRDYLADGDEVQLRRLRLWIRTNLTRRGTSPAPMAKREQAEQAAVRA